MNTSISPPVAATPVAEVPVTLPIGDAGASLNNTRGVVVAREVRDAIGGVGTQTPSPGSIPGACFHSLQAEFVAVSLAWFAVLGATALGGLL